MERLDFTYYDPVPVSAPPNDDLELQLVWLHMAEQAEGPLTHQHFADAWLRHIHYMWDEYGRTRWNLRRGVPAECAGSFENPFHSGMGAAIRSEIWACLFAGDPQSAADYAALDASLDHGREGIAGEVFLAVLQSLVAAGASLDDALTRALGFLPADCETARAIGVAISCFHKGLSAWDAWRELLDQHGHENFTHAPLNVALSVWALCHGGGDFETSILLAVNAGYDTDCTAATVGATLGLLHGPAGIPAHWSAPIGDGVFVGPGIRDIDAPVTLGELSARTAALIGKLEARPWNSGFWDQAVPDIDLTTLPGTILVAPFGGDSMAWANGELPDAVKRAGGGTWVWEKPDNEPRKIICLARKGARLSIDDRLLIKCPPGLPYVPATHRCPQGSHAIVELPAGKHTLRIELDPDEQDACVILAYPDMHLCPWTHDELPQRAVLPVQAHAVHD